MQIAIKALVGLIGLLLGSLGLRWMFAPSSAAMELGISLEGAVALNTARGDLGGMFVAGALLCAIGIARRDGGSLRAVALLLGCVATGRVIGIVSDGSTAAALLAITIELVMLCVLLIAARRLGSAA